MNKRIVKWDRDGERSYRLRPEFCHPGTVMYVDQSYSNERQYTIHMGLATDAHLSNQQALTVAPWKSGRNKGRPCAFSLGTAKRKAERLAWAENWIKDIGLEYKGEQA